MTSSKNNGGWTPEKRAAAAERIRKTKPWLKTTGPRTDDGKAASKNNALKHGGYSAAYKELMDLLKEQKKWMESLSGK